MNRTTPKSPQGDYNTVLIRTVCVLTLLIFSQAYLKAQSTDYYRNTPAFREVERLEIMSGSVRNNLFLDIGPIDRRNTAEFLHGLDSLDIHVRPADNYWGSYIFLDNRPWSKQVGKESAKERKRRTTKPKNFIQNFYRDKANFLSVNDSNFKLYFNPVLYFQGGSEPDGSGTLFRNTRGIELRGAISNKVGFYTYLADNQANFPDHVKRYYDSTQGIPSETYWKPFKKNGAVDFLSARGYVTFTPIKQIDIQFGNGRNFIGSGYRSLLLSDFATDYTQLKINTQVWRIHYLNIFAQMTDLLNNVRKPLPRKYAAFHYLSVDAAKWINFGLFEGVIFNDAKRDGRGFDFTYLNPIIFYRYAEQSQGSGDNAAMGANLNMIFAKQFKVYGQLMLDDLKISELKQNSGWWGNKYGLQAGLKWVNVLGLSNVDWQTEFNTVRPYTYSSDSTAKTYIHYGQALAHPLGANFNEWVNIVNLNPWGPLNVQLKYITAIQGQDDDTSNFGANSMRSYATVPNRYNNHTLQGYRTTIRFAEATATYMALHNLFIDGSVAVRTEKNTLRSYNTLFFGVGLRLNFFPPDYTF